MTMVEEINCDLSIWVEYLVKRSLKLISYLTLCYFKSHYIWESQGNFAGGSRIQLKILLSATVVPAYSEAHSCSSRICAWSTFSPYYYYYLTDTVSDFDD